jgi:HEAT repeat protein
MGEPSYSALAQFLNSPYKPDDRNNVALDRAVASFAELGPSAVPALLAAIRLEASGDLRHNGGIAALGKMGPTAFPALEKALQDSDREVRVSTVVALRFFGMAGGTSPTLTSALITVLKDDPVSEVRTEAAMTLSSSLIASKEVTSALAEALGDEDEAVRVQAAYGLASSGVWTGTPVREAAAGLPVLIQALKSEHAGLRSLAAISLQFLGPAAQPAVPALTLLLEDSETGQWAADALGAIGGEAIAELQKAANGTSTGLSGRYLGERLARRSEEPGP